MATLKITQTKSRIGATAKQRRNLEALGLHRIHQSVRHSDSAVIKGMLERVSHLVEVKVEEEKAAKKAAPKAAASEEKKAVAAEPVEAAASEEKKAPARKPAAKKVTKTKKEE